MLVNRFKRLGEGTTCQAIYLWPGPMQLASRTDVQGHRDKEESQDLGLRPGACREDWRGYRAPPGDIWTSNSVTVPTLYLLNLLCELGSHFSTTAFGTVPKLWRDDMTCHEHDTRDPRQLHS